MTDERRAKDVVRDRDVAERTPLWAETTNRMMARYWRRPAGSSARLWKKVGADDPFLPPKAERKMVEAHRQVSAAGRFVRIDKAQKKKKGGLPGPKKQGRQENVPEWVKKLREQAQNRAAAGKSPPKIRKKAPSQVHTPSALTKAPTVRPGSKKHKNAKPPPPPPQPQAKRVSKSGRLLPQRPSRASAASGAPGKPPLIRDHKPDTAGAKAFADLDAQETDRRPPLIRPDAGTQRRGGPIRRGVAPPGGAPPLIRPGEGRAKPDPRRRGRPTPTGERPKRPPGGAPPLVRDFQPETGPRDPFKERFGASSAPKRTMKRIQRGAAPPGGAPPLIKDGKPINSPKPMMETPPTRDAVRPASKASSAGGDPFADFLSGGGPSEGRTRLKRAKATQDAPKRKRPVIGGPPPGGSVPLNRDAEAVSSSTLASKNPPPSKAKPAPKAPAKPPASSDPFGDFLSGGGPSEGRTRLKRSKPADEAPKRKRPVIGGPPPGGSVPLNRDADAVSSPTQANKTPPPKPKAPPKKPVPARRPSAPASDDPFADFLSGAGPSEGRTRLKRTKPSGDPPKRKRPVIGGPPPGGTVPLNRDAEAVSSPTTSKKKKS